jgi:dienelactone hydrolase
MSTPFAKILPLSAFLLAACATAPFAVGATEPDCVDLTGKATAPNPVDKDGRITHFNTPAVRLMRTKAEKSKGTALIFPSGGYHVLSVISDGTDKAKFWNDLGYDAAILEYTISQKGVKRNDSTRDAALKDALASVRLVRDHAKELGLHEGAFVLMGGSAGGHLATRTVAALSEKERPDMLVLFYPAYLDEVPAGEKKTGMTVPSGKLPRLFATIAVNDEPKWVAGARTYVEAWNKAPGGSGKATFKLFDDGFHGFRNGTRAAAEWPDLLKAFESGK